MDNLTRRYAKGFNADMTVKEGSSGTFFEKGEPPKQGSRADLCSARQAALEGGMRAVTATEKLQGIKVAQAFLTYNEPPRSWKPKVIWLHGPSGAGKSLRALTMCAETYGQDIYHKKCGSKWWDGYDAHQAVVIDDFRGSWWGLTETLSLLDRYPKMIEIKGGWRQFKPRLIVVTSIFAPSDVYKSENIGLEPIQQLLRRIDETIEVSPDGLSDAIKRWEELNESQASQ